MAKRKSGAVSKDKAHSSSLQQKTSPPHPPDWIGDSTLLLQLGFLSVSLFAVPQSSSPFFSPSIPSDAGLLGSTLEPLAANPITSLAFACVGVGMVQIWYGMHCRKRRLQSEDKGNGNFPSRTWGMSSMVIAQISAMTIMATLVVYVAVILLGAPVTTEVVQTLLLSLYITLYAIVPISIALPAPTQAPLRWTRLISMMLPTSEIERRLLVPCVGTVAGAYVGTFCTVLDWGRPWQAFPIPCVLGAWFGHLISSASLLSPSSNIQTRQLNLPDH